MLSFLNNSDRNSLSQISDFEGIDYFVETIINIIKFYEDSELKIVILRICLTLLERGNKEFS